MARYFISYSRSDQAFALRFAQDLKTAGVDVWVDQLDIPIGQNWDRSVEAAVRDCEGFVIILSPRSAASEHVADEVACALEDHKHIIPILIEKCTIPMRLARLQFIDATSDYDNALARFQLIIRAAPGSGAAIAPAASGGLGCPDQAGCALGSGPSGARGAAADRARRADCAPSRKQSRRRSGQ